MDFTIDLQRYLLKRGFEQIKYNTSILWIRDEGDCLALLDIIPESLPGQPRLSAQAIEDEMAKIENNLMIRFGKRVERLTLMLCHDLPDQNMIKETLAYPDIWWFDWKHAKILVYENQRSDFFGLKKGLEDFALAWGREAEQKNLQDRNRMLQPVTLSIVAINVLAFVVLSFMGNTEDAGFMARHGAMTWDLVVKDGEYYRLLTAMFLHFGPAHLLQNMLVLILTGSRMERAVGRVRYLVLYLGAGLFASVFSMYFTLRTSGSVAAGASGAIFGVMGGIAMLLLKDTISGKKRYFKEIGLTGILFMVFCAASYGFTSTGVDNAAHIGGLLGGFLLAAVLTMFDS